MNRRTFLKNFSLAAGTTFFVNRLSLGAIQSLQPMKQNVDDFNRKNSLYHGHQWESLNPGDYNFMETLDSVPLHARLEQKKWYVWGASVVKGKDGKYHMIYCRWPKKYPFGDGWLMEAELCLARSERPTGPFEHVRTILMGRKFEGNTQAWDAASVYNPHLKKFNGKYYLYYTGTNDPYNGGFSKKREILVRHQCIGVLVANSLKELAEGNYRRFDNPLLKPLSKCGPDIPEKERYGDCNNLSPANIVVVNPSVVKRPDGKYLMIFKGWQSKKGFGPVHGVAMADSPDGSFEVQPEPIFEVTLEDGEIAMAEDPFIWYYRKYQAYFALVKDFHGDITNAGPSLALFCSENGLKWQPADQVLASKLSITWEDGSKKQFLRMERPQLLLDTQGNPQVLYVACAPDKRYETTFNIHIPLIYSDDK